jgi:hypothetical protein
VSNTLQQVAALVAKGDVRVSDHGYDELAADGILVRDLIAAVQAAQVVEDYPDFRKGACVLVLQRDRDGKPVHVLRGIPKGQAGPAVLVTAYRPDPARWSGDMKRRTM